MKWFRKRRPDKHVAPRVPNRKWTREEIFETVAEVLVDALGVERYEVTEDARLMKDLGAY